MTLPPTKSLSASDPPSTGVPSTSSTPSSFDAPSLSAPSLSAPSINASSLSLHSLSVPSLSVPSLNAPSPTFYGMCGPLPPHHNFVPGYTHQEVLCPVPHHPSPSTGDSFYNQSVSSTPGYGPVFPYMPYNHRQRHDLAPGYNTATGMMFPYIPLSYGHQGIAPGYSDRDNNSIPQFMHPTMMGQYMPPHSHVFHSPPMTSQQDFNFYNTYQTLPHHMHESIVHSATIRFAPPHSSEQSLHSSEQSQQYLQQSTPRFPHSISHSISPPTTSSSSSSSPDQTTNDRPPRNDENQTFQKFERDRSPRNDEDRPSPFDHDRYQPCPPDRTQIQKFKIDRPPSENTEASSPFDRNQSFTPDRTRIQKFKIERPPSEEADDASSPFERNQSFSFRFDQLPDLPHNVQNIDHSPKSNPCLKSGPLLFDDDEFFTHSP